MKLRAGRQKAWGFTLLELLITLSVAAILMAAAAPGFQSLIQQSKQESRLNELTGALYFARSEAIKRASRISVCARNSNTRCGTDWDQGWIVFVDNGASPGVIETTENILKVASALPNGFTLGNSAIVQGTSEAIQRPYVRFGPRGLSNWRGAGSFTFCDTRGTQAARAINVSMSGDVRAARADGSGVRHDAFGSALKCATPDSDA